MPKKKKDDEWYTPGEIVAPARALVGGFDLDVASCERANAIIQAARYYTAKDNGLVQPWFGRVWMNPPYSTPLITFFARRLREKYVCGDVDTAFALTNNKTETEWFQCLVSVAAAIVFPYGRIRFINQVGQRQETGWNGQALFYFGDAPQQFIHAYRHIGWGCEPQMRPSNKAFQAALL